MTFKRKCECEFEYPEDILIIREYMDSLGEFSATDQEIDKAWREYSCIYEASWLEPNQFFLEGFASWIEEKLNH